MSKTDVIYRINLQLFAEGTGGDGGTGDGGASGVQAGVSLPATKADKNPLKDVKYGIQDGDVAQPAPVQDVQADRNTAFEAMIKGEYRDLYNARVEDTVQKRLKNTKETVERYNALTPTLELLAKKYGVDMNDIQALNKAIDEDDSYFEDEALEKGITVEQLKSIRKMERENAELKRQMQEQAKRENADRLYAQWMDDSQKLKGIYPGFDLQAELQNPRFTDLLRNHIDVRTAYEVIHKDEIIPAAMQFTARQVEQKLTNKIMAGAGRPVENSLNSASASVVRSDVSQLSKADRAEINRRVANGEKIRF